MALFTVRIELHGATAADYDLLHRKMEQNGFRRTVPGVDKEGKAGTWLLPSAEYDYTSGGTAQSVRDIAKEVADTVKKGSWCLVTKVAERSWSTKKIS